MQFFDVGAGSKTRRNAYCTCSEVSIAAEGKHDCAVKGGTCSPATEEGATDQAGREMVKHRCCSEIIKWKAPLAGAFFSGVL